MELQKSAKDVWSGKYRTQWSDFLGRRNPVRSELMSRPGGGARSCRPQAKKRRKIWVLAKNFWNTDDYATCCIAKRAAKNVASRTKCVDKIICTTDLVARIMMTILFIVQHVHELQQQRILLTSGKSRTELAIVSNGIWDSWQAAPTIRTDLSAMPHRRIVHCRLLLTRR